MLEDCMMEGEVYEILYRNKVQNVHNAWASAASAMGSSIKRRFRYLPVLLWLPEDFRPSISLLRHHRLILDTVGERLENFLVQL